VSEPAKGARLEFFTKPAKGDRAKGARFDFFAYEILRARPGFFAEAKKLRRQQLVAELRCNATGI
jgi:hypothetical protein